MSFSFVLIDKENCLDISSINQYLMQYYSDYEILYCCKHAVQIQNLKNFVVNANDDVESIINSVVCNATKQNIVIIRKFTNNESIKQITDNIKSPDSIVYFKKEYKGIKKLFCNTFKKLARQVLRHTNHQLHPRFIGL